MHIKCMRMALSQMRKRTPSPYISQLNRPPTPKKIQATRSAEPSDFWKNIAECHTDKLKSIYTEVANYKLVFFSLSKNKPGLNLLRSWLHFIPRRWIETAMTAIDYHLTENLLLARTKNDPINASNMISILSSNSLSFAMHEIF